MIESMDVVEGLRPRLSKAQERAVYAVFDTLEDPTFKTGAVEVADILKKYKPGRHPKVRTARMPSETFSKNPAYAPRVSDR